MTTPEAIRLLLTGDPGSGKTTAIRRVVERMNGRIAMSGFTTEELREGARRVGFRGVTLDGRDFLLAHVRNSGSARVGPYGVDLVGLESTGIAAMTPETPGALVVIDEIGKMECLSDRFKERVTALLDGGTPLLATVAAVGVGFVKQVRQDPRVTLLTMSRGGSERMAAEIVRTLERALRIEGGRR
jgi:nucleoside-triphosphatase